MANEIIGLSREDVSILQKVIDDFKRRRFSTPSKTPPPENDPPAPEAFLAMAPSGGIAAVGLDDHTGTGTPFGDLAHSAECEIYRVVEGVLTPQYFKRTVYNVSSSKVLAYSYVRIWRDKFGTWFTFPDVADCGTLTVTERDLRCEGGILRRYTRNNRLVMTAGCLSVSYGTWAFVADEGCCDCTDLPTTTGTGTALSECCGLFTNPVGDLCATLWSTDCPCLDGTRLEIEYNPFIPSSYSGLAAHSCSSGGGMISVGLIQPCKIAIAMTGNPVEPTGDTQYATGSADVTVVSCSPLVMYADVPVVTVSGTTMCSGTVRVVISEAPCTPIPTGTGTFGGGPIATTCCPKGLPNDITAQLLSATCPAIDGIYTFEYAPALTSFAPDGAWFTSQSWGEAFLYCDPADNRLKCKVLCSDRGVSNVSTLTPADCSPPFEFDIVFDPGQCCGSATGTGTGGGSTVTFCGVAGVNTTCYLTITNASSCACMASTTPMIYNVGDDDFDGANTVCSGKTLTLRVYCNLGSFALQGTCDGVPFMVPGTKVSDSPLLVNFTGIPITSGCCSGSINASFSE